jgi:hypothetical protein
MAGKARGAWYTAGAGAAAGLGLSQVQHVHGSQQQGLLKRQRKLLKKHRRRSSRVGRQQSQVGQPHDVFWTCWPQSAGAV